MAEVVLASGTTNSTPESVVRVQVSDIICAISVETNEFGDTLPVIPTSAQTEDEKILYEVRIKAKLTRHADGRSVSDFALAVHSNRPHDKVTSPNCSDTNGELILTLHSRQAGDLELGTTTPGVTMAKFKLSLKEAWYQSKFLITGYNVCDETDFSGQLVVGTGLSEKHKEDFLYGAAGVPMQGTGKAADGQYIHLKSKSVAWHRNAKGNRDHVETQSAVEFHYAEGVRGAFGWVTENHSIAVDPTVIPRKAKVSIENVGVRFASDTGSAIKKYHIDNFLGFGKSVVSKWLHSGVNGTNQRVKYLGDGS